jgi:hypothetical protein
MMCNTSRLIPRLRFVQHRFFVRINYIGVDSYRRYRFLASSRVNLRMAVPTYYTSLACIMYAETAQAKISGSECGAAQICKLNQATSMGSVFGKSSPLYGGTTCAYRGITMMRGIASACAATALASACAATALLSILEPTSIAHAQVANNNTGLQAIPSTQYQAITRLGVNTPGDGGRAKYVSSNLPCSLNAGNGDGQSQVKSADGHCWLKDPIDDWLEHLPLYIKNYGVQCDGLTDDGAQINTLLATGRHLIFPAGTCLT